LRAKKRRDHSPGKWMPTIGTAKRRLAYVDR
jgi:hypothetical protein